MRPSGEVRFACQKRSFDRLVRTAQPGYSGNPAFRRPSINSFAFDCRAPGDMRRYCKGGIDLKHTRRRVVRLSVTSEMGEGGREAAASCHIGGILTKGFLQYDDRLVKAAKPNKGMPNAK